MSWLRSNMKSTESPFLWVLFSAGTILALIYAVDQLTDADLMGALWRQVKSL